MIMRLLKVVLFWRRNNIPSIIFKSSVWATLAWLVVGIFSSFQTALIGGAAAFLLAGFRYTVKYFKRKKMLLKKIGGDKEKLKKLQAATNAKGFGGALMNEMLMSELDIDDDDDEESDPLTEEQLAENKAKTTAQCEALTALLVKSEYATEAHCKAATGEIMEYYGSGEYLPEPHELLEEFLPQCVLCISGEDYCDDGDHASIMDELAESTLGKWNPGKAESIYDEETDKWLLHFHEGDAKKTWRFKQNSDYLNGKFLDQLIQYTQAKSGNVIHVYDNDEEIQLTSLPPEIHEHFYGEQQQDLAA